MRWYNKAQIDYASKYLELYIAYNAWYRSISRTNNNRQAINLLKKRYQDWEQYIWSIKPTRLGVVMVRLSELTQQQPLPSDKKYWNGEIANKDDWRSLIEFWYKIRCNLVHGASVKSEYVGLAYESLNIFMGEIVQELLFT